MDQYNSNSFCGCFLRNKNYFNGNGWDIQDTKVLVGPKKEKLEVKVALSNSFGFGGHNSSILFAPFQ